ncbi:Uncharacterised protein [Pandoraea pulmonicola]|uniref:Uncharacterized protein n=1 Tax=Pandoraea pulmonicola TaxID=93221 RepID=A0AAJ4ZAA6_PANPU|nr:Uncharacterised protein [Pandoraea pulmonicola]
MGVVREKWAYFTRLLRCGEVFGPTAPCGALRAPRTRPKPGGRAGYVFWTTIDGNLLVMSFCLAAIFTATLRAMAL